jgi:hypothetical protein
MREQQQHSRRGSSTPERLLLHMDKHPAGLYWLSAAAAALVPCCILAQSLNGQMPQPALLTQVSAAHLGSA